MSTLTHADSRPNTSCAPPRRIVTGQLALVFVVVFGTLMSFYLLLSVTPRYAAEAGAGSAGAGLVTGALLAGTVAAELVSSILMKRHGYRTLLAVGAVLLGLPELAMLYAHGLTIIVTASVVRGFGFGLSTVVTGAVIAELLPPERRGEGLSLTGVVDLLPAVLGLPAGVWLADHYGSAPVVAMTSAMALIPLAVLPWLPRATDHRSAGATDAPAGGAPTVGLVTGLRNHGQLRPLLVFAASTMAAGIVVSFLPLAAGVAHNIVAIGLFVQAVAAMISQFWAGRRGDRRGHSTLLVPGLAIASLGMMSMIWLRSPVAVIAAMCVFGAGFGISENATFALMIDRMPASGLGTASALWSLGYDVGYGAGPVGFGLVVGHTGYPAAFALTGALMLAALPVAWRARVADRRK
jgi:predicted MFS family arabinose efflux permease